MGSGKPCPLAPRRARNARLSRPSVPGAAPPVIRIAHITNVLEINQRVRLGINSFPGNYAMPP
eukprot:5077391-Alexandrium_andersonii.AAC.1